MELVSFISIEDDPPDLILSFAIWQRDLEDIRSLILIRRRNTKNSSMKQVELDLRRLDKGDIAQASKLLRRMNFDNRFKMQIV